MAPFQITLGSVFDPEGDGIRLKFDQKGNTFINIDKSDFANVTLSVNQVAPIGVYTVTVNLSDDNEVDPVSKDYRFIIIIRDGKSDEPEQQLSEAV